MEWPNKREFFEYEAGLCMEAAKDMNNRTKCGIEEAFVVLSALYRVYCKDNFASQEVLKFIE